MHGTSEGIQTDDPAQRGSGQSVYTRGYLIYVVALLFSINFVNYFDRNLMVVLLEPIRLEFGLSDSQAGLLNGAAFSVVYTLMALPIARLADTRSRRKLLAAAVGFWSVMTGLCGIAGSFFVLLAARLGVGVGESGVLPMLHSLVSDTVSPRRRALVLTLLAVANTGGMIIGFGVGGYVAEHFG